MDKDQDIEVELYQENVGNLNYSTPTGSRSSSPDRFPQVLSSQEPTQRTRFRLEEFPFVAIDPRPDHEDLSHALTSQVPRIHDSCHTCIMHFILQCSSVSSAVVDRWSLAATCDARSSSVCGGRLNFDAASSSSVDYWHYTPDWRNASHSLRDFTLLSRRKNASHDSAVGLGNSLQPRLSLPS